MGRRILQQQLGNPDGLFDGVLATFNPLVQDIA